MLDRGVVFVVGCMATLSRWALRRAEYVKESPAGRRQPATRSRPWRDLSEPEATNDLVHPQDPQAAPREDGARGRERSPRGRPPAANRSRGRCRSAAARMGSERRRVARAQLRPLELTRDYTVADQLADGLQAEEEVDVRPEKHERVRSVRVDADLPERDGLLPGPELERLRGQPYDRQARVEAHV